MTKQASPKYSLEVHGRAVRMVFDYPGDHASQWAASARSRRSSAARRRPCATESGRLSVTKACELVRRATTGSGSRDWNGKSANCAKPTTVEFATLEWVDWFNNRRLLEPIGGIPPSEAEARYYAQ